MGNFSIISLNKLQYMYRRHFSLIPKNPKWSPNTIINFCDQGSEIVVERFGRFHRVENAGVFFAIPLIERCTKIDRREMVVTIDPQMAITRDNVRIELSGSVYLQFVDSFKALYGAVRPLLASVQQAQAIMRSAVGKMELDDIFHNRTRLNKEITTGISEAAQAWGLAVNRYEVTDIIPDPQIAKAMDLQAAAERERRQQVRKAEADKEQTVLLSEGQRIKDVNESEGVRIRTMNEAEGNAMRVKLEADAEKERLIMEAEGRAKGIIIEAEARKTEIELSGTTLVSKQGHLAIEYSLGKQYLNSLAKLGQGKGTIVVPLNLTDVANILVSSKQILTK